MIWNKVSLTIDEKYASYLEWRFPLDNFTLPYQYTVLSPVVWIEIFDANKTFNVEELLVPGLIELTVDYPASNQNISENLCLGFISGSEWSCETRNFTLSNN